MVGPSSEPGFAGGCKPIIAMTACALAIWQGMLYFALEAVAGPGLGR